MYLMDQDTDGLLEPALIRLLCTASWDSLPAVSFLPFESFLLLLTMI